MTNELDALIIRSLPELNDSANRLGELDDQLFRALDRIIDEWKDENDWAGVATVAKNEETWLSPRNWQMTEISSQNVRFRLGYVDKGNDQSWLTALTRSGVDSIGFELKFPIGIRPFKRLWRAFCEGADHLPLNGSDFFFACVVDREALAAAIADGDMEAGLEPFRASLDRLPELAAQLESLREAIEAEAKAAAG